MVHSGLLDPDALEPIKGSKSEVLFCPKPLHMYTDETTLDGADLSPILLPIQRLSLGPLPRDGADVCAYPQGGNPSPH